MLKLMVQSAIFTLHMPKPAFLPCPVRAGSQTAPSGQLVIGALPSIPQKAPLTFLTTSHSGHHQANKEGQDLYRPSIHKQHQPLDSLTVSDFVFQGSGIAWLFQASLHPGCLLQWLSWLSIWLCPAPCNSAWPVSMVPTCFGHTLALPLQLDLIH